MHARIFVLTDVVFLQPRTRKAAEITLENEKFFELKSRGYRDGIKRKETR